jgi:hypothetical protein
MNRKENGEDKETQLSKLKEEYNYIQSKKNILGENNEILKEYL